MGGRQGPRPDARPALRHRCVRGRALLRHRARARRCSATPSTSSACSARRRSTTWTSRTRAEQLRSATLELVARNGLRECYIRPIVYRGYGTMGLNPLDACVDVTIACWEWGKYLGEDGKHDGVRAKVSSWRRIGPDSLIPHAKASGQYLNSVLAKVEAVKSDYDEAILLDDHGYVCEGTGENIYVVRDGVIATPGQSNSILDGITRRSIMQLASRPRLHGRRARHRARRDVPRRRGVHVGHGRGDRAGARGRRPRRRHRQAGRDHARDPVGLRRRDPRPLRALPRVAGRRQRRAIWRRPPARRRRRAPPPPARQPDERTYSYTTPRCATAWAAVG